MPSSDPITPESSGRPTFQTTLVRVMSVQVVTLLLLWLLQSLYHS